MIIIKIGVKIKLIFANELILPSKAKYAKIIVTIITIQLLTSKTLEIATLPASIDEVIIKTLNEKRKLIILPLLPKYLIINFWKESANCDNHKNKYVNKKKITPAIVIAKIEYLPKILK